MNPFIRNHARSIGPPPTELMAKALIALEERIEALEKRRAEIDAMFQEHEAHKQPLQPAPNGGSGNPVPPMENT